MKVTFFASLLGLSCCHPHHSIPVGVSVPWPAHQSGPVIARAKDNAGASVPAQNAATVLNAGREYVIRPDAKPEKIKELLVQSDKLRAAKTAPDAQREADEMWRILQQGD